MFSSVIRKPVTRQMIANHLEVDAKINRKSIVGRSVISVLRSKRSPRNLSKLERGFHWNSIQPCGENCPGIGFHSYVTE